MNIAKYSSFRLLLGILVSLGCFASCGFVVVEEQATAVYQTIADFDTVKDNSFQKYLGNGQTLIDSDYIPGDLVYIDSDFTANNARKFQLRKEAAEEFADLAWNFWHDNNGDKLLITSTYRSSKFQASLLKNGCSRARCAEVGTSEHQLGLAVDLGVMTKNGKYVALSKGNKYYQWLLNNSANWGFHNTYQKGIEVDGQMEEGWHRRYLGSKLANQLSDQDKTFSERYIVQQLPNSAF